MRTYEEKLVSQKTLVKSFCDKCSKEIEEPNDYILNDKIKVTYEYCAYGDYWVNWGFEVEDLCLDCCKSLKELLIENGYKVKELE